MTYTRFTLDRATPALWRAAINHPPINLIDSVMIRELGDLFAAVERGEGPAVLLFDSADPDYFLAHYDITDFTAANRSPANALPAGPTGFQPWVDILVRLGKLPAVTIAAIRGRARGAGSEFVLASDIRFASRERAVLGQFEVGLGAIPGGGPASRLPRLVGRGRAFEILLGGKDFDGALAELYGYVNRAIPDAAFDDFVDHCARRVATFDRPTVGPWRISSASSTTSPSRPTRHSPRRWTPSCKQRPVRRFRRESAKRSQTGGNNAPRSSEASASMWDSSPKWICR